MHAPVLYYISSFLASHHLLCAMIYVHFVSDLKWMSVCVRGGCVRAHCARLMYEKFHTHTIYVQFVRVFYCVAAHLKFSFIFVGAELQHLSDENRIERKIASESRKRFALRFFNRGAASSTIYLVVVSRRSAISLHIVVRRTNDDGGGGSIGANVDSSCIRFRFRGKMISRRFQNETEINAQTLERQSWSRFEMNSDYSNLLKCNSVWPLSTMNPSKMETMKAMQIGNLAIWLIGKLTPTIGHYWTTNSVSKTVCARISVRYMRNQGSGQFINQSFFGTIFGAMILITL